MIDPGDCSHDKESDTCLDKSAIYTDEEEYDDSDDLSFARHFLSTIRNILNRIEYCDHHNSHHNDCENPVE